VSGAVDSSLVTARARGHTINCQLHAQPLPVIIDSVRVEQIVCNLINNAIKFTPTANEICVQTSAAEGFALITVKDNGIGFLPETAESLFTPFLQANPTIARSAGGLGIGLTIVRRLAELHGGSVRASSDGLGKGACFVISIPMTTMDLLPIKTSNHFDQDSTRRRIVIVEDNADIRETLRSILGLWGHDVFAADNGISGVELIQRELPDIALIDVGLPALNGYEVAKTVKAALPKIQLIAITGYGQPTDKLAAIEAGFDHHLLKPVEPALLKELLAKANHVTS
jgi:CheY-like chemotaxis protein